jgi:hypothetical protein
VELHKEMIDAALGMTSGCLEPEAPAPFESGAMETAEAARAKAHLAACPRCSAELALLVDFENATPAPEERNDVRWISARLARSSPVPRRRWWLSWVPSRPFGALAASAAALALVTAGLYLRDSRDVAIGPGSEARVVRSGSIGGLAPEGDIAARPQELSWEPAPGAARYQVELMEVDRSVLWMGSSSIPSLRLPADAAGLIQPAKTLLWQVSAFDREGRRIASSLARFRLTLGGGSS